MSTERINKTINRDDTGDRFAKLAALNETVFHAHDLAVLWGIFNKNTLHTTLKRYVARGLLHRIYKGLYALQTLDKIDETFLGAKAIHHYCYVSTETVLVRAGVIMQHLPSITFASDISRKFTIDGHSYIVRKIADRFLYNAIGIERVRGVLTASPERACADILSFNPRAYFDAPQRLYWNRVREIQKDIGYPLRAPKNL